MIKKPKFIILLYHKIGKYPQNAKFPGLYVTEENFDEQIKYLKDAGYVFLTLSELKNIYDYYYNYKTEKTDSFNPKNFNPDNSIEKNKKYAAITFDDGSKSIYSSGLKVMRNNGVTATVFMVSGLTGRINEWDINNGENEDAMLNVYELEELMKYGVEIGAHTLTHPHLTGISPEEAFTEISNSKKDLEDLLGVKINFFAYPYGEHNEEVKSLVRKAGFYGACITKTGIVKNGADFFALKRVAIRHNTDFFKFKRKILKVRLFY